MDRRIRRESSAVCPTDCTPAGPGHGLADTGQGDSKSALYRREWLRRGGLVLAGTTVAQPHRLSLHDGQQVLSHEQNDFFNLSIRFLKHVLRFGYVL